MKKISIIIPCYNEEKNIQECLKKIPPLDWETEIIVVDDGSTDRTSEYAQATQRSDLKVIRYEKNLGKGAALRRGLQEAKGDTIVILDADYTTPPPEIKDIVSPIMNGKADFANGTRFIYPMEKKAMSMIHILSNKISALIISAFIAQRLTDSLCGLKAFRKEPLGEKLRENSWPDFELLVKAKRNRMKIVEVPVHYMARKAGTSKMSTLKGCFLMPKLLITSLIK